MDNFRLIAAEKEISYNFICPEEEVLLWVDKTKFEKIFFNLLSNAFKYTPSHKSISVKITTQEQDIEISVIDEGVGISKGKQITLFQRFESLVSQNMLQPSSGIGLSLVKELVEMHHGSIEVVSETDKGSEFKVKLLKGNDHFKADPQAEFILSDGKQPEQPKEVNKEKTNEEETEKDMEKLSVLIVEDNTELKDFLQRILSHTYEVIEAENGKVGLGKATEILPDLIISDVMMPEMDGLDMVKAIKENKEISHIPIILLSAKSSLDDRIKGLEHGIDDYITKPFSSTYLKTRIKNLLKQRQELQQKYLSELTLEGKISKTDLSPALPQITSYDEEFLKQVMDFMEKNMDNTALAIDDFADELGLSRSLFYRKLKAIIGISPIEFVKEIRIKRAVQLMNTKEYNISQVAYMTGFNDPKYFSRSFKKQTGLSPTEYREKLLLT